MLMSLKYPELITYLVVVFFKDTSEVIFTPLHKTLKGVFPNEWKVGNVTPVGKGNAKRVTLLHSYRCLSKAYNLLDSSSIGLQLQLDAMSYDLYDNKCDCAASIGMQCYRVPYRAQQRQARPHHRLLITAACYGRRTVTRRLVETTNAFIA
ncbi:hypothetical protein EVAR_63175_1 [Eumeta japonica]|uniref:Uncharacterized protein n=1 Tax=Eumeta variegata TaxID=151549 RepID=A0A4C1Z4W8_EUMVA|nr:hypothetical protein EVAR_63175_1 [Eumeta japonica]